MNITINSNPTVIAARRVCRRISEAATRIDCRLGDLERDGEDSPLGDIQAARFLVRLDDALVGVEEIADDLAGAT